MRKTACILLLAVLFVTAGCKKSEPAQNTPTESVETTEESGGGGGSTLYVRKDGVITYADLSNAGKTYEQIKGEGKEAYNFLKFGNKVSVIEEKQKGDVSYSLYQTPSGDEFWIETGALAAEFVVLTESDIKTYTEPDESYGAPQKMQTGDLGFLKKELNGFMEIEFYAYRPTKSDGKPAWVGTKWIKKQKYADDVGTAKAAYYLYLAYYWDIQKNNPTTALKMIKDALEDGNINNRDVKGVIEDYKADLERRTGATGEIDPDATMYRSSVDNLRLRSDSSVDGEVLGSLALNEVVELLETGPDDTINGIDSSWLKVKNQSGIEGWVFGGYLEVSR